MDECDTLRARLKELLQEHAATRFPRRCENDELMEALLELAEYDSAVVGYGMSLLENPQHSATPPCGGPMGPILKGIRCATPADEAALQEAIEYGTRVDRILQRAVQVHEACGMMA